MSKLAMISYVALSIGYYGGRMIEEGETFPADFRQVARDGTKPPIQREQRAPDGTIMRPAIYPIKRDRNGNAVRLERLAIPEWAAPENEADIPDVDDAPVEKLAKQGEPKSEKPEKGETAKTGEPKPDGLDRMNRDGLIGYAAEKGIDLGDLDKVTKADMVAAIRAAAEASAA